MLTSTGFIMTEIVRNLEKILIEYLKAVDSLTIDDSYRLKKKIIEYEGKINDVPKVEELQSQLVNRIVEKESIKMQLEKLKKERESEALAISTRYETEMQIMKEQMKQIMSMIQQNPQLAYIKQEALVSKKIQNNR
jgi:DNA repair exonuclease SbcCD nuclease subunit